MHQGVIPPLEPIELFPSYVQGSLIAKLQSAPYELGKITVRPHPTAQGRLQARG